MKVLLVGGGVTSAVTGMCIRKMLPECKLNMWDKARGTGGRMATSRCTVNDKCIADLGAQYLTTTEDFMKSNEDVYHDLIKEGIIEPLQCKVIALKPQGNKKNFVVPRGIGFLVKHFFQKAKLNESKFLHHVTSINKADNKWIVETKTGEKEEFDVVILTMPVPQIFLLEGTVKDELNPNVVAKLNSVSYSCRFVLILFFSENLGEDWGAQYLYDDPIFRYVSVDNLKRNRVAEPCAVVFHTTVDFGLNNLENTIADVQTLLVTQAKLLFPNWPEPVSVKCHKWKYSQVINEYPDSSGCLVVSNTPTLMIGGDGFTGSTFDKCVTSSKSICSKIGEIIDSRRTNAVQ